MDVPKNWHIPLISTDDTDKVNASRPDLLTDLVSYQCCQCSSVVRIALSKAVLRLTCHGLEHWRERMRFVAAFGSCNFQRVLHAIDHLSDHVHGVKAFLQHGFCDSCADG